MIFLLFYQHLPNPTFPSLVPRLFVCISRTLEALDLNLCAPLKPTHPARARREDEGLLGHNGR